MRRAALMLTLAVSLAACGDHAPEGQVVATVNGEEITRPQLNAALAGAGEAGGKDTAAQRNAVLDQIVMQQLVVQEAKRQGIDRSQDYLLAARAAGDRILTDMLAAKVVRGLRPPYARDIAQFIQDNPGRFARREILTVDQIRYPAGGYPSDRLGDAHDLGEIARRLTAAKVAFDRQRATIDTATLPAGMDGSLQALPPGEPFVVVQNGEALAGVIVSRRPEPIEPDVANRLALELIRQDASRNALAKQVASLRQNAKIAYQPGFAAPKAAPAQKPAP